MRRIPCGARPCEEEANMATLFTLLRNRCGLTQTEAMDWLTVNNINTVKSWGAGRNPTPAGVIDSLTLLYAQIDTDAGRLVREITSAIDDKNNTIIVLGVAETEDDAKRDKFDYVGPQNAMIGMVAAQLPEYIVQVERRQSRGKPYRLEVVEQAS
jgi:hypothetical protein